MLNDDETQERMKEKLGIRMRINQMQRKIWEMPEIENMPIAEIIIALSDVQSKLAGYLLDGREEDD